MCPAWWVYLLWPCCCNVGQVSWFTRNKISLYSKNHSNALWLWLKSSAIVIVTLLQDTLIPLSLTEELTSENSEVLYCPQPEIKAWVWRVREEAKGGEITGEVRGRDGLRNPHPSRVLCHHPSSPETDRTAEHDFGAWRLKKRNAHIHAHCRSEHQETAVELRVRAWMLILQLPAFSLIHMIHQSAPCTAVCFCSTVITLVNILIFLFWCYDICFWYICFFSREYMQELMFNLMTSLSGRGLEERVIQMLVNSSVNLW